MARQKGKSIREINSQGNRLYRAAVAAGNEKRAALIGKIQMRYMKNIERTKSYQKGFESVRNKKTEVAAFKRADKVGNRKYSRSTYMGLSNG